MADYNRVIMVGNLTRDPDYRALPSGQGVCRLSLASNRQYRNRQTGNLVQEVCYVDIDVWGAQAESCRQYLQKGRAVLVEGRLKLDTWEDANGQNRSKHLIVADRVVFLSQNTNMEDVQSVGGVQKDPGNQLEKELLDQIDKIKERASKKEEDTVQPAQEAASKSTSKKKVKEEETLAKEDDAPATNVEFKDEPPFKDDLPF